jgi:hypothetical protein
VTTSSTPSSVSIVWRTMSRAVSCSPASYAGSPQQCCCRGTMTCAPAARSSFAVAIGMSGASRSDRHWRNSFTRRPARGWVGRRGGSGSLPGFSVLLAGRTGIAGGVLHPIRDARAGRFASVAGTRVTPSRRSGVVAIPATRNPRSTIQRCSKAAIPRRVARAAGTGTRASTTLLRTSRICTGSGMSTGQTCPQAPQETQSDCGPAAASRPWWKVVLTSPIAPV